jgi:ribokinase|tara:strand:- start:330 stop:1250 length:921 start_codon:yes stop_codon:yes gene_type:complete
MSISILGIYVADLVFFGKKIPVEGETILGNNFVIGPGGKGSNQAVAAAKAGVKTYFISKIGDDQFGSMARKIYEEAGVDYSKVIISSEHSTGAAGIFVDQQSGKNAINVVAGAAGALTTDDIDQAADVIKNSQVFLTQLEAPKEVVFYALKIAKENNVTTVLNPAPATLIDKEIFPLIDYFTPNETEAGFYVNHKVEDEEDAKKASDKLLQLGIKNIIITLGEKGAFFANDRENFHVPVVDLNNPVLDTTGAGDAFNGGFAVALTENEKYNIKDAIKFASATAGLSTTKIGTANSMPSRDEIDKLL